MRKFVFLLLLTACLCASAQEIQSDTEDDGTRMVTAEPIVDGDIYYTGSWVYMTGGMESRVTGTSYSFAIAITGVSKEIMPSRPKAVIRFFDGGQTLMLESVRVENAKHKDSAVVIMFNISEAQFRRFKSGLNKIRVELKEDYVERTYDTDVYGKTIYKAYENIRQRLAQQRKSFADGF